VLQANNGSNRRLRIIFVTFLIVDIIFQVAAAFKHFKAEYIIEEIEHTVERAFLVRYHSRVAQDICSIEIYRNIDCERHAMHSHILLAFEVAKQIDAGNHRKVYCSVTEKAESLSEAPIAMVAHIGKQANDKIDREEKNKPEDIVPDWKQQP
jgi:hypothetical protein